MFFDITAQPAFQADAQRWNREWILEALQAAKIHHVLISFDGSGDSGQIEWIKALDPQGAEVPVPEITIPLKHVHVHGDQITTEQQTTPLSEAIEELCYNFLADLHYGWEDNDGSFGEFTIDVATGTITLDYNERFTDSTKYNHTL